MKEIEKNLDWYVSMILDPSRLSNWHKSQQRAIFTNVNSAILIPNYSVVKQISNLISVSNIEKSLYSRFLVLIILIYIILIYRLLSFIIALN